MRDWVSSMTAQRGMLIAAAAGYLAIAGLSLVPEAYRPHLLGVSDKFEHLIAYLLIGILTARIIPPSIPSAALIALIGAYAGLLEMGQMLVPCRSASLLDLGASVVGVTAGVMIGRLPPTQQA